MQPTPTIEHYTTAWTRDEASDRLFRLSGGILQTALAGEDAKAPDTATIADAYRAAAFGGLVMSTAELDRIERELRARFIQLWRALPHVTAIIIPRDDPKGRPLSITAALHCRNTNTWLAEPVADFESTRASPTERAPETLLRLIRLAVRAWRSAAPDEWNADVVFDTIALIDALSGNDVPCGLVDALQNHGIFHLDFNPNFSGDWDDSLDLTLDE
jgi:hypothetical protein